MVSNMLSKLSHTLVILKIEPRGKMRVCDLTMDGVLDSYIEPDDAYQIKKRESQMTKNIGEADPYS